MVNDFVQRVPEVVDTINIQELQEIVPEKYWGRKANDKDTSSYNSWNNSILPNNFN